MHFERDDTAALNAILACTAGEVRLRAGTFTSSLIVTPDTLHGDWRPALLDALAIADFACLLDRPPDVLLLGTGGTQRMPPPELFAALARRGIGLEVMDNRAACRTFNLLLSESRNAALALLL